MVKVSEMSNIKENKVVDKEMEKNKSQACPIKLKKKKKNIEDTPKKVVTSSVNHISKHPSSINNVHSLQQKHKTALLHQQCLRNCNKM